MKQLFLFILFCLIGLILQAQHEFHVTTTGKTSGNGTIDNPWDLQTALNQKPDVVNGDDTIWLHEGIYNGRYVSTVKSTRAGKYVTVAPYKQSSVVLNGNAVSKEEAVLTVRGQQVLFRDFEITWLGDFSRDENEQDFKVCAGISHTTGEDCRFYNLIIHNNPGLGIGSWKHVGGTIIENCMIYHNGYIAKDGKGRGEGIYVQNKSDQIRLIKNNIIFSNYYKGVEVWSAGRNADFQFVKNINLENNVIFNSGSPSGFSYDNVIVASDDRNGINMANNVTILSNVFYHNTNYLNNEVNGNAPSLTLGFYHKAPVEDIVVKNNIILGRNNALRMLHVKSVTLTGNTIYSGYLVYNTNDMQKSKDWKLEQNSYYTKNSTPFNVEKDKKYTFEDWQTKFNLDKNSQSKNIKEFDLKNVLSINVNAQNINNYTMSLFNKQGQDVVVDFSLFKILKGTSYKIYDIENRKEILTSGIIDASIKVNVPMNSIKYDKPLHNDLAEKTLSNFGVFIIEFENTKTSSTETSSGVDKILK